MATEHASHKRQVEEGDTMPSHLPAKKQREDDTTSESDAADNGIFSCFYCLKIIQGVVCFSRCCGKVTVCRSTACKKKRPGRELEPMLCTECDAGILRFTEDRATSNKDSANSDVEAISSPSLASVEPPTGLPPRDTKGHHNEHKWWLKMQYEGWGFAEVTFTGGSGIEDVVAFSEDVPKEVRDLFWDETIKFRGKIANITHTAITPLRVKSMFFNDVRTRGMRIIVWEVKPLHEGTDGVGQVVAFCIRVTKKLKEYGYENIKVVPGVLVYPSSKHELTDLGHLQDTVWLSAELKKGARVMVRTAKGRVSVAVGGGVGEVFEQLIGDGELVGCLNPMPVLKSEA